MTEDQHIALVEVGNYFWDELGKLVARCLTKLPQDMDLDEALIYLSDHSSVYGTEFDVYLKEMRKEEGRV
jgi:hypothetical protein